MERGADLGETNLKKNPACKTPACLLRPQLCKIVYVYLNELIRIDLQGCPRYVFKGKKASCQDIKYEKHQIEKKIFQS